MDGYDIIWFLYVSVSSPLKNDGVKVSWDDDIPCDSQLNGNSIFSHVPNHQPVKPVIY
jgi:hypothetical protein